METVPHADAPHSGMSPAPVSPLAQWQQTDDDELLYTPDIDRRPRPASSDCTVEVLQRLATRLAQQESDDAA